MGEGSRSPVCSDQSCQTQSKDKVERQKREVEVGVGVGVGGRRNSNDRHGKMKDRNQSIKLDLEKMSRCHAEENFCTTRRKVMKVCIRKKRSS